MAGNPGKELDADACGALPAPEEAETLAREVLGILGADFTDHGAQVVSQLREADPKSYLTLVCRFVPSAKADGTGVSVISNAIDLTVRYG